MDTYKVFDISKKTLRGLNIFFLKLINEKNVVYISVYE